MPFIKCSLNTVIYFELIIIKFFNILIYFFSIIICIFFKNIILSGITPGSMPPFSRSLDEEGIAVKSFKIIKEGAF